jgi:hypothetical protein
MKVYGVTKVPKRSIQAPLLSIDFTQLILGVGVA